MLPMAILLSILTGILYSSSVNQTVSLPFWRNIPSGFQDRFNLEACEFTRRHLDFFLLVYEDFHGIDLSVGVRADLMIFTDFKIEWCVSNTKNSGYPVHRGEFPYRDTCHVY